MDAPAPTIGPGAALLPVGAGVGDDQGRLAGEHRQGFLVLPAELPPRLAVPHVEVAHPRPLVNYRGRHEGGEGHRRAELTETDGGGELLQVADPQRPGDGVQVLEEQFPLGRLTQPLHVGGVPAQHQVVVHPARIVQGDDGGVGSLGQGTGAVHHRLERRVHVQALDDQLAGPAQAGQPLPQQLVLPVALFRLFHGVLPARGLPLGQVDYSGKTAERYIKPYKNWV